MKLKTLLMGAGIGMAGLIGFYSTSYTISATEHAVITRMGKPIKMIVNPGPDGKISEDHQRRLEEWSAQQKKEDQVEIEYGAGLYLLDKLPFVDSVHTFDARVLEYDSSPKVIVTKDKKKLMLENYARWQIENPVLFMQTLVSEVGALMRLDDIVYNEVREQTGSHDLIEIVRSTNEPIITDEEKSLLQSSVTTTTDLGEPTSKTDSEKTGLVSKGDVKKSYQYEWQVIKYGRSELLKSATEGSQDKALAYGIWVSDVRIKTADLPPENADSVYKRMIAERARIATQYRSEGEEEAIKIRSDADKQDKTIRAGAFEEAGQKRGAADQEVFRLYTEAQKKDPEFFLLWRTKRAYETAFAGDKDTTLILDGDTSFNQYLLK